jgi:hypothetical protein
MTMIEPKRGRKRTYVIFSIDTEHDTFANHTTQIDGWCKGVPWLCEIFDDLGMRGKVCWLVEYNLKEGILAANPDSAFFVKEFPAIIKELRLRGDSIGIHPTMYDWLQEEGPVRVDSYHDFGSWDLTRSYNDPEFVLKVISSAVQEIKALSGVNPVGCRTGACHYATHLAAALVTNGIYVDSSTVKKQWELLKSPNAYYTTQEDIRRESTSKTGLLEIPSVKCMQFDLKNPFTKLLTEYFLHIPKPIFLSLYIHNWAAITANGEKNEEFLQKLSSFLSFLRYRGVHFLSWVDIKETFDCITKNV